MALLHVHIPRVETVDCPEGSGSRFQVYEVHVNGLYHCVLRFSELLNLNNLLNADPHVFEADSTLPEFPRKKLFSLNDRQIELRRQQLEKWLQSVIRHPIAVKLDTLHTFLLNHQVRSCPATLNNYLEVTLMDGSKHAVLGNEGDGATQLMRKFCDQLGLPRECLACFGLFIVQSTSKRQYTVQRWLGPFESPLISHNYLSQRAAEAGMSRPCRLILRRTYWDPLGGAIETSLLTDRMATQLLYAQSLSDVELGLVQVTTEVKERLEELKDRKSKRDYVQLSQSQRHYGAIHLEPCLCDYPASNTTVVPILGNFALTLRYTGRACEVTETVLKITRIRSWRLVMHRQDHFDISIEYFMARDSFEWITLKSSQSVLIAQCLQSMVEQFLISRTEKSSAFTHSNGHASVIRTTSGPFAQSQPNSRVTRSHSSAGDRTPHRVASGVTVGTGAARGTVQQRIALRVQRQPSNAEKARANLIGAYAALKGSFLGATTNGKKAFNNDQNDSFARITDADL